MPLSHNNQEDHPDEMHILAYIDSPGSPEMRETRVHLAGCRSCRQILSIRQSLIHTLKHEPLPQPKRSETGHPDEFALADYVEGQLTPELRQEIKTHLISCRPCMTAARHYMTHSIELRNKFSKEKVLSEKITPSRSDAVPEGSRFSTKLFKVLHNIVTWRMPVLTVFPAMALTVFLIVFTLNLNKKGQYDIISFQENPYMTLSAGNGNIPGIGFFSKSREENIPFSGVSVQENSDEKYEVSWPAVKGAVTYNIRIFSNVESRSRIIDEKAVSRPPALLDLSLMKPGTLYSWELTGKMEDGKHFISKGGLVLKRPAM